MLMKLRPQQTNFDAQFDMNDPYGHDSGGDWYIKEFLRGFHHQTKEPSAPGSPPRMGYAYIETVDPQDNVRYRYTGEIKVMMHVSSMLMGGDGRSTFQTKEFALDRAPAITPPPRYGVTYDDISTREERNYWIAGSSLKVIDLQTNEVVAERIGYMMDSGQGNTSGGRSPWLAAADHACPGFQRNPFRAIPAGHGASAQAIQTLDFVEKVLKPKL